MKYTLQELHTRFIQWIESQNQGFTVTTNQSLSMIIFDQIAKKQKEIQYRAAAILKMFYHCKDYAIFIDKLDEDIIYNLPYFLKSLEDYGLKNLKVRLLDEIVDGSISKSEDFSFTGKVYLEVNTLDFPKGYIYQEIDKLDIRYRGRKIKFVIRCNDDYINRNTENRIKIFLCHDSRDKEYVFKIYTELSKKLFDPWLDQIELELGDSLIEKITDAINTVDFGLVFLSKNFLSNEKWVKFELQSLLSKQINENRKFILPIWLNINTSDLSKYPWLLDKVGANSNEGLNKVVDKIIKSAKKIKTKI